MIELIHGKNTDHLPRVLEDLKGRKINSIITDPPYGVDHVSSFAKVDKKNQKKIEGDGDVASALEHFYEVMDLLIPHLADEADVYIFTSWKVIDHWVDACRLLGKQGLNYTNILVWEKGWPGLGDLEANWPFSCEFILYLKKGRREIVERRSSVLAFDKPVPSQQIHPTEKPVALLQKLLMQSTNPGDLLIDPWAGSGSLLEACRLSGRDAIGIEMDSEFYERAQKRLSVEMLSFD